MRVKLDENLPASLAADLAGTGHEVHTSRDEGLSGASDAAVCQRVCTEKRLLITQDLDFSDSRRYPPKACGGILLVRLAVPGRLALRRRVLDVMGQAGTADWRETLVVVTDHKIRVRRPSTG